MYYVIKIYGTKNSDKENDVIGVCILDKHPKCKEQLSANGIYYELETRNYYNVYNNSINRTSEVYSDIIECIAKSKIMKEISKYSWNKFINTINELEVK